MINNKLKKFFNNKIVDISIFILIIVSILVAIISAFVDYSFIEFLNYLLILFFVIELIFRIFCFDEFRKYFKLYFLDWIAIIPWELIIGDIGLISSEYFRFLRAIRLIRILRFYSFYKKNFRNRVKFFFKRIVEKSIFYQILIVFVFIVCLVLFFGFIFSVFGISAYNGGAFWFSVLTLLGPDGMHTTAIENNSPIFIKIMSVILTTLGVVIFNGVFVAIVVSKIQIALDRMREGKGVIFEKGHYVILGWTNWVKYILEDLEVYCKTERKRVTVVILTETNLQKIKNEIRKYKNVSILLRSGEAYVKENLNILSIEKAKNILIFCDESIESRNIETVHDSFIIKTYFALYSILNNINKNKVPPIIANFLNFENSRFLGRYKFDNSVVFSDEFFLAKYFSLLTITPEYYYALDELLSYRGSEFHFYELGNILKDKGEIKFRDILFYFKDSIPVGVVRGNESILVPKENEVLQIGDKLIVLAENEGFLKRNTSLEYRYKGVSFDLCSKVKFNNNKEEKGKIRKKIAILGYNPRIHYLVHEFNKMNIVVDIFSDVEKEIIEDKFKLLYKIDKIDFKLINFRKYNLELDLLEDKLCVSEYDKILIIPNERNNSKINVESVDGESLFKLLKIIDLIEDEGLKKIPIFVEILSPENEGIIKEVPPLDYVSIVGTLVISKIFNMGFINKEYIDIFYNLIQRGGTDLVIGEIEEDIIFKNLIYKSYKYLKKIPIGFINKDGDIVVNPNFSTNIYRNSKVIYLERSDFKIQ